MGILAFATSISIAAPVITDRYSCEDMESGDKFSFAIETDLDGGQLCKVNGTYVDEDKIDVTINTDGTLRVTFLAPGADEQLNVCKPIGAS